MLEIKLPELTIDNSFMLIRLILFYAANFIIIAIICINQHLMFADIEKVSTKTIWFNLFLLFTITLIPLPTSALGENFFDPKPHFFTGIVLAIPAIAYTLVQYNISNSLPKEKKQKVFKLIK